MNLLIAIASVLMGAVHAVPAPQGVNVYQTESLYPHYAFHQQPFPFNPYPNPFHQSAYVQHPLALNETIKKLEAELKTLQDLSVKSSAAIQQINAKSAAALQTKFATAKLDLPKVDQKLKVRIIGETDHGTINIVNPFIAGAGKTLNGQPENTNTLESGSQGNVTGFGDDFLKGVVPFPNSNLDPVFGPEIAPKYEIHYVPENFKFEDFGNFFPFAGPDFTSFGAGGVLPAFPDTPKNDQPTSQPPGNDPITPANDQFTPSEEPINPGNDFLTSSTSQTDFSESTESTTFNYFNTDDQTSSAPDLRLGGSTEGAEKSTAEPTTKSETDSAVGAPASSDTKTGQSSLVGGLPSFAKLGGGGAPLNRGRRVPALPWFGRFGGAPLVRGRRVPAPAPSGLRKAAPLGRAPAVKPARH